MFHFGQPPQQLIGRLVRSGIVESILLLATVVVIAEIIIVVGRIVGLLSPRNAASAGLGRRRMADVAETRPDFFLPLELLGSVVFRFLVHQIGRGDRQVEQDG